MNIQVLSTSFSTMFKQTLFLVISTLFIIGFGCARQTAPTGGPKDTIPPVLIKSYTIPKPGQTNYKGNTIELSFTENIILNNPKEQLIIIPDIGKDYEIAAKKRKVIITLKQPLKDSTTYSINFRDAVQDITEKNPAVNLKLAFSTGNYIDSLGVYGLVYELLKNKETKDATIALYQSDTFNIFKHKPIYLTKSNDKGNYQIENLKPGSYYIYAWEDKNKNLIVDSRSELYGFLSAPVNLTQNERDIVIPILKLDARTLKMTSGRPYNTYFNIKTSKGLHDYKITTSEKDSVLSAYGEDRANIRIYNTFQDQDSTQITFSAIDSMQNRIDTTLYMKFSTRVTTPEKFQITAEGLRLTQNNGLLTGTIKFSKPILSINYDSIYYQIDSIRKVNFTKNDFRWDPQQNVTRINKSIDKKLLAEEPIANTNPQAEQPKPKGQKTNPENNQLYIGKSFLISIDLDTSTQLKQTLKPLKLEDTGVIIVSVETKESNFIVDLLDKNFNIIKSVQNSKKVNFNDLNPGDYQLRLVIDSNNDGQWSPGNFIKKEEPEKIIYYMNDKKNPVINLKANFELGPLLIKY